MKRRVRRLLSLLMVLILVCTMVPAALAAGTSTDLSGLVGWYICVQVTGGKHEPVSDGAGGIVCAYCGTTLTTSSSNVTGHSHTCTQYSSAYHKVTCATYGSGCSYHNTLEAHTYGSGGSCVYCGYKQAGSTSGGDVVWSQSACTGTHSHYPVYQSSGGYYDYYTCSWCGATGYVLNSTYTSGGLTWTKSAVCSGNSYTHAHNPVYSYSYSGVTYYTCSYCSDTAYSYSYGTDTGYGSDYAYGTAGLTVYAYDSMTNDTYSLNETVTLAVSPSMWISSADKTADYNFTYSWAGNVSAYSYGLNSNSVYMDTSGSSASVSCTVTAYNKTGDTTTAVDTATVYWYATAAAGNGIYYSAIKGANVTLDANDLKDFWAEQYPYGTLSYVRFTGVSSGNLYDNYAGGTTGRVDVRSRGTSCYLSPSYNQTGLDDLTYVPSAYNSTGPVTIQFTAYGTAGSGYGYNYATTSLSGTITILYTAKAVTPIQYQGSGSSIALKADDFVAKYKEVMGLSTTTAASSLTIQFLEAPVYGSLYMNYNSGSYYYGTGTQLTSANIGSYTFSTSAYSTYAIDKLTYIPGSYSALGDSLKFACYYGGQLKFVGTVEFGAMEPVAVEYTTMGATPVSFSGSDFTTAALASGYLYFGTPSSGTLYRNYANGTGEKVDNYDTFTASYASYGNAYSVNTLTYVPAKGYAGVVEIPMYSANSLFNTQELGTLKIYVGRSFTDVTGTSSAWALPYINKLSAQGVVKGTNDGTTFSPLKEVTYGEALKLIMMAAGYPEQAKTGTHWASGYLTKAYANGLVSSSKIDLNATVTREEIAAITAKALGLGYATSVNAGVTGPSDTSNGYVYALYNAGIVDGTNKNGVNYFNGTNSITRAEISKIVCKIAEYEK